MGLLVLEKGSMYSKLSHYSQILESQRQKNKKCCSPILGIVRTRLRIQALNPYLTKRKVT